ERHGDDVEAEDVFASGPAGGGDVRLARGEVEFARLLAVHVHDGVGVHILRGERDALAFPALRDGELTLIPRRGDGPQGLALPVRVGVDGLAILLNVAACPRPETGDLEMPPAVRGDSVLAVARRLPAPQPVQADALAGGCFLAMRLVQVPDSLDARRESRF